MQVNVGPTITVPVGPFAVASSTLIAYLMMLLNRGVDIDHLVSRFINLMH